MTSINFQKIQEAKTKLGLRQQGLLRMSDAVVFENQSVPKGWGRNQSSLRHFSSIGNSEADLISSKFLDLFGFEHPAYLKVILV